MNFKIGDKVICVNNKFLETDRDLLQYPKVNNIYIVRGVYPDGEAIYLVGIHNLNVPGTNEEPCFLNWRFIKTQELSKEGEAINNKQNKARLKIKSNAR
ncbi:MAG: hypothetical protein H8E84_05205 [Flavobacteriales bacterium]|nr:hypothetical protein [Flavobacteriales bacterium]